MGRQSRRKKTVPRDARQRQVLDRRVVALAISLWELFGELADDSRAHGEVDAEDVTFFGPGELEFFNEALPERGLTLDSLSEALELLEAVEAIRASLHWPDGAQFPEARIELLKRVQATPTGQLAGVEH